MKPQFQGTAVLSTSGKIPYGWAVGAIEQVLVHATAQRPLAAPENAAGMLSEIRTLGSHQCLLRDGAYRVFAGRHHQTPSVISDIGRLRELTLRHSGEGTGLARDLDHYDDTATHLFVWDGASRQVVGAARWLNTDAVLLQHGVTALPASEFFDFDPGFFARLGPALEVGRWFVRPECQWPQDVHNLMWRGLRRFVDVRPQIRAILTCGSISPLLSQPVRRFIAETLQTGAFRHGLSGWVTAKRPIGKAPLRSLPLARDSAELAKRVSELDPGGSGLPLWIRNELAREAQFLAFGQTRMNGPVLGIAATEITAGGERGAFAGTKGSS